MYLSRCGFADGARPAASTGDADAESQQELFSRLGRDSPVPLRLANSPRQVVNHPARGGCDVRSFRDLRTYVAELKQIT